MKQRKPAEKPAAADHAAQEDERCGEYVKQLGKEIRIKNLVVAAFILKYMFEDSAHRFHMRAG